MTKKRIVIFISIAIAGCIALGMAAYHGATSLEQGYKDVAKMNWALKLSDKYTAITPSTVKGEFYFHAKDFKKPDNEGVMRYNGDVIFPPTLSIFSAGDGWYSAMDEYGVYTYMNTEGVKVKDWTYTVPIHFFGDYAIVGRSDGQQMMMDRKGKIIRKLKTKKIAFGVTGEYYGLYDERAKKLQVLEVKTDKVAFESDKYSMISDLPEYGYTVVSPNNSRLTLLGKDFEPLLEGETFTGVSDFREGIILVTDEKGSRYLDLKNRGMAIKLPQKVITTFPFSEGAAIIYTETSVCGIDTTGKVLFEKPYKGTAQIDGWSRFSGGVAPLTQDGIHWGYINKAGEYVVKPIFEEADNANGGYGAVRFKGLWGILCL